MHDSTPEEIAESFGVDTNDVDIGDVDIPEYPETLDLSEYSTAHGAAKAAARHLRHYADMHGHVTVDKREQRHGDAHVWTVAWESGSPYEWAVWLTGGESIYHGEFPIEGEPNPQIVGFYGNENWGVECERSFVLGFYPQ